MRPNLLRVFFLLVCLLAVTLLYGQVPNPVQVPTPYGPNGYRFYTAVDKVTSVQLDNHGKARQFTAVMAELGVTFMVEPSKIDFGDGNDLSKVRSSTLYKATQYALKSGCTLVVWRAQPNNLQPYVYSGGQRVLNSDGTYKLTYWGRLNGIGWDQPFYPPPCTWAPAGKIILTPAAKTAAQAAIDLGLDPKQCIAWVFFNEECKGGQGGPFIGSFAQRLYPPDIASKPDGYIPPAFWTMARTMRYNASFLGMRTYGCSFEDSGGPDGDLELGAATSGDDCARFFAGCSGYSLNCYAPPGSSPSDVAAKWAAIVSKRLARADANPILALCKHRAFVETNVMTSRLSTAQLPNVADYRNALLDVMPQFPNVDFIGMFTSYGFAGCNLYDSSWAPVGGVVGPFSR